MEITNLTIRIILLITPGLICYYIIKKLTEPREEDYLSMLTEIIIYSFISYGIFALEKMFFSFTFLGRFFNIAYKTDFLDCLTGKIIDIPG